MEIRYHDDAVVNLEFDSKLHAYRADGEPVPSATKVLGIIAKPALVPWALKSGSEWLEKHLFVDDDQEDEGAVKYTSRLTLDAILKGMKSAYRGVSGNALGIGTDAHAWIEDAVNLFLENKGKFGDDNLPPLPEDPETSNSCQAFLEWVGENDVHFEHSEAKIYNRLDRYAGTVDCVAVVNGARCIIDWKTSRGIYPEYHLQVAAYAKAWEDMSGQDIDQTIVLRLDKGTGRYQVGIQGRTEWNSNFDLFLSALHLYNGMKRLK